MRRVKPQMGVGTGVEICNFFVINVSSWLGFADSLERREFSVDVPIDRSENMAEVKSKSLAGGRVRCLLCGDSAVVKSLGVVLVTGSRGQVAAAGELLSFLGSNALVSVCGGCGDISAH